MRAGLVAMFAVGLPGLGLLTGCGGDKFVVAGSTGDAGPVPGAAIRGVVLGAGQPVKGATVQLYAAGLTGPAANASALLHAEITTDTAGAFSVAAGYSCPSATAQLYLVSRGGTVATSSGRPNTAIAEMSVLGPCSAIATGAAYTVDEATTVAAAWALAQFVASTGMVGASATNATGLANAVLMAQALVDGSTGTAPGHGFGANAATPVSKVNTLANLLSLCAADGASPSCAAVLESVTPAGGTMPTDLLAAAVSLAHAPATGAMGLFALAGTSRVYGPGLTAAPGDWTLAATYTGGGLIAPVGEGVDGPTALAVDGKGQVWVANHGGVVSAFSTTGLPLFANGISGGGLDASYGLAIDSAGNIWVSNSDSPAGVNGGLGTVTELSPLGQAISGADGFTKGGLNKPNGLAIDANGTVWIADNGNAQVTLLNGSGVPISGTSGFGPGQMAFPGAVAIDGGHNGWIGNSTGSLITRVSADGASLVSVSCCDGTAGLAIDGGGTVWATNFYGSSVSRVSGSGEVSAPSTDSSLLGPEGIALDGAGNAWVANFGGDSVTELAGTAPGAPGRALSPAGGWGVGAGFNEAIGIAIDASGNVWVANFAGGSVTELIGAAAPVRTPLLGPVRQP